MLGDTYNVINNAGIGGNNSSQMLARIYDDVLSFSPDWVFGQVGVNDFYGYDFTAQQVFDNVTQMIDLIIENGSQVLWLNCFPQESTRSGFTTAKSLKSASYNKMLSEWASGKPELILIDVYSDFVDKSDSTNGSSIAGYLSTDKIHLSTFGGYKVAQAINGKLKPTASHFSGYSPLTGGVNGVNATNFNGTAGVIGAGAAGIAPTGWTLSRASGTDGTVTGSRDFSGYNINVTKSIQSEVSLFRLQSLNLSSSVTAGQSVSVRLICNIDSGDLAMSEFRVYSYVYDGVTFSTKEFGRVNNGYTYVKDINTGDITITVEKIVIPTGVSDFKVYIESRFNGAGSANIKLYRCEAFAV
jgi:lysophospholipase L1-like esterase